MKKIGLTSFCNQKNPSFDCDYFHTSGIADRLKKDYGIEVPLVLYNPSLSLSENESRRGDRPATQAVDLHLV
jgi:hypothetical protein